MEHRQSKKRTAQPDTAGHRASKIALRGDPGNRASTADPAERKSRPRPSGWMDRWQCASFGTGPRHVLLRRWSRLHVWRPVYFRSPGDNAARRTGELIRVVTLGYCIPCRRPHLHVDDHPSRSFLSRNSAGIDTFEHPETWMLCTWSPQTLNLHDQQTGRIVVILKSAGAELHLTGTTKAVARNRC